MWKQCPVCAWLIKSRWHVSRRTYEILSVLLRCRNQQSATEPFHDAATIQPRTRASPHPPVPTRFIALQGIRDVNRRASFPASLAEHASLHLQHISTGSPEKIYRGSWSYGKARDGVMRVVSAKGGLAVTTGLVVMIAIALLWWSTSSVPVEVEPIDVSLGINGKFHQPRQVSFFSRRNDGTHAYHAATYKYVIDVLAFGS